MDSAPLKSTLLNLQGDKMEADDNLKERLSNKENCVAMVKGNSNGNLEELIEKVKPIFPDKFMFMSEDAHESLSRTCVSFKQEIIKEKDIVKDINLYFIFMSKHPLAAKFNIGYDFILTISGSGYENVNRICNEVRDRLGFKTESFPYEERKDIEEHVKDKLKRFGFGK